MSSVLSQTEGGELLRIALITAATGLGGAEKQMFYIARELGRAGAAVRVLTLNFDDGEEAAGYEEDLARERIPVVYVGRLPTPFLRLPVIVGLLREFAPHVIQSIHAYTNVYSASAGRLLRALSIGGLRGDLQSHMRQYRAIARCLLRMPDAIAANSRRAVAGLDETGVLPPERVYYLENGVDLADFPPRTAAPRPSRACRFLCAGRVVPGKRMDVFLRAVAAARRRADVHAVIAGDGPGLDPLRRLAAELGLVPDHLELLGVSRNMPRVLSTVDAVVICSEAEGTPNVLLEAMAAGLPVLSTPAGDAPEIVTAARAGYVIPLADAEAAARAMLELAASPRLRQEFGSAGRRYVEQHHSLSGLAERLFTIYAEASRNGFGRRHPERARFIQRAAYARA